MDVGPRDLFHRRLDDRMKTDHELMAVAKGMDWDRLAGICEEAHSDKPGHPPLPTLLMAGRRILNFADNLSERLIIQQYVQDPFYQYFFCGEKFFLHDSPTDSVLYGALASAPGRGEGAVAVAVRHQGRLSDEGCEEFGNQKGGRRHD